MTAGKWFTFLNIQQKPEITSKQDT
jgi:hypothetical protein